MRAVAVIAALAIVSPASARVPQGAERRAILDALRPSIEAKLGPNVEFVVQRIGVENGWGFVAAEPQRRGGGKINGKAYFPLEWEYQDGLATTAILRFQNERWNLIESAIGATDAWYCGEPRVAKIANC